VAHRGAVAGQTTQVLKNIHAAIRAGGATFDDVVML
jgi:enamine deaminase RidA (YjgF/YER057c/UK114 family)